MRGWSTVTDHAERGAGRSILIGTTVYSTDCMVLRKPNQIKPVSGTGGASGVRRRSRLETGPDESAGATPG